MRINVTLEDVFEKNNIVEAIEFLKMKKNSCSDDGIWLHDLEKYWELNGSKIEENIKEGKYVPQIVHEKVIVSANGKHRKIALMSSVDRLILRAILQVMQKPMENIYSPYSFAYRVGSGVDDAVICAAKYIEQGREYVVETDIKDFFENVEHSVLLKLLKEAVADVGLYMLLEKYIVCQIETDYKLLQKNIGIIQGSSLSPLLSNLYLSSLDKWMEKEGFAFVRFADNINIYVSSIQEGSYIMKQLEDKLLEYHLKLNQDKKGIFSVYSRRYLGYNFEKNGKSILVKKYKPGKRNVFSQWHKSAIEKMEHNYYIVNDGILTKKDFTILFDNEEKKAYIPIETTDALNIYSNVIFSANFLEILKRYNLNLNIYDKYGVYIGSFYSSNQRNKMKCLIKQVEIYCDKAKRLDYAKRMDVASVHNLRCNLRYYYKHTSSNNLKNNIAELSEGIRKINEANSVGEILLIEARCRQKYYNCLNDMISDKDFYFTVRTKRPPKDEINAMISFGNVYLYQKIAQMIHKTSVDIRISFVHSAMKRYENLNLDIADIFKPIIVDRVICTLINKKMISKEKHFQKQEKEGMYLNNKGKTILLQELDKKMKQIITVHHTQYTYDRLIYQEIRDLERSFMENVKYKPFKYQM